MERAALRGRLQPLCKVPVDVEGRRVVALGRIAVLNPDLFEAAAKQALTMYDEQTETEYPGGKVAVAVWPLLADLVQEHARRTGGGD